MGSGLANADPEDPELEAVIEAAHAEQLRPEVAPWGFVVSKTQNGRHRKLHHVGSCFRVPGLHYKEFDVWGDVVPPLSELHSQCANCFGKGGVVREAPVAEQESEVSSVSSSSSSSGKEPPGKKAKAEGGEGEASEGV